MTPTGPHQKGSQQAASSDHAVASAARRRAAAERDLAEANQLDVTLKALAHPVRRHLLELMRHDGAAAIDLAQSAAATLGISRSRASQHLGTLARAGLVDVRPDATRRHYRVRPDAGAEITRWLEGLGKP